MAERTRPPYAYRWAEPGAEESEAALLARLLENALGALAEVVQRAASEGSEAGVRWAMEYLDSHDAAEDADFEAYEAWRPDEAAQDRSGVGHRILMALEDRWGPSVSLECSWEPADQARPCWPHREDSTPEPPAEGERLGCVYADWLDNDGFEALRTHPDRPRSPRVLAFELADADFDGDGFTFTLGRLVGEQRPRIADALAEDRAERRLCAHADADGEGIHVLEPGERCPREETDRG